MKFFRLAALAVAFFTTVLPAAAQWQTPNRSFPVGLGAGKSGFRSVGPCATGLTVIGQGSSADPVCGPIDLSGPGVSGNPFRFITGGGTANDTVAVQAAFTACGAAGGCMLVCTQGVTYTVSTITVSSNTYLDGSGCVFKQRVQGASVFVGVGATNVHMASFSLRGNLVSGSGLAGGISGDKAIAFSGNSSNLWFHNFYITRFGLYAIYIEQSSGVNITNGLIFENAWGTWFRGVSDFNIANNRIKHTAMYNIVNPNGNQLNSAIAFESTDQNPYGISKRGTVTGNVISEFPYSQAIFGHALEWVTITGNTCYQTSICVSLNPYNLTDTVAYVTVGNNIGEGTNSATLPTDSDAGVVINGGPCSAGSCPLIGTVSGGSGYSDGIYFNVPFTGSAHRCDTGGTPYIASATITVAGGSVASFSDLGVLPYACSGTISYVVGDVLSATGIGPGTGFTYTLTSVTGGNTPLIRGATVTGNTMHAFNRVALDTQIGCYSIGYTDGLTMTGNVADSCGANGYVFKVEEVGAIVSGNTSRNPVAVGTTQNGFLWLGAPRATMTSNMATGANGANGIGYKVVGAVTNFKWKDSGAVILNGSFDNTTVNSP